MCSSYGYWTSPQGQDSDATVVHLLGKPHAVIDGHRVDVPPGSKRLFVFLALARDRLDRRVIAGKLWPDGVDDRAAGNLRSALWRLKCAGIDVIDCDRHGGIRLHRSVVVDVHLIMEWAARLIEGKPTSEDLAAAIWRIDSLDMMWDIDEDWAIFERERIRQRLMHALEALSRHLVRLHRCAEGVEVALMAVRIDPLRESAQRVLIEAYLAEGNLIEGYRSFRAYREQLRYELGVEPSPALESLLDRREWPTTHGGSQKSMITDRCGLM